MTPMLALVTEAYGGSGGIGQFNRDLLGAIGRLSGSDFPLRVRILPRLAHGQAPFPALHQDPPRRGRIAYSAAAAVATLRQRPGLILSGHLYHGPLAWRLARARRVPLISVLHGTEVWERIAPAHLAPLLASDLVICVSEDTRAHYLRHAGDAAPGNAQILYNTVEDRFTPGTPALRAQARAGLGLADDIAVLSVGRLDPRLGGYKGHDMVIRAMAQTSDPRLTYLIAGTGSDRARLDALVATAGLTDRVRFLGHVPDADLPALYRAADLFALPSRGEGFGIVFVEAMASGTPAIGLAVGGAAEVLQGTGAWGVTVEGFAGSFREALRAARDTTPDLRQAIADHTRDRFGPAVFGRTVRTLFADLIV